MPDNADKCIIPKCKNKPRTRGLCHNCYQCASGLVRQKISTWDELVAKGLAKKSRFGGRISNPFTEAFKASKEQNAN